MKIVLCGFMGCGKSTIGRVLAKTLKYKFLDMDKFIELKYKMTVTEIFAQKGESFFRQAESDAIIEILQNENVIVGSGGGTVINPENVELIHKNGGKIYFLDVPLPALQERLKRDIRRPLLQREDRKEFIEKLFNERYSIYKNASDLVVSAGAPIKVVVKTIVKLID